MKLSEVLQKPIVTEKSNKLTSTAYGVWTFEVKGRTMDGTLVARNSLYRIVKISKE